MSVKAFEIATCIDRVHSPIQCVECCGRNLYVGTTDSFVLQYLVEEFNDPNFQRFHSTKQKQKYLGLKKPVLTIKAASALNRILVLCDSTLFLLSTFDLELVESGSKIKGVVGFCINQDPHTNNPFSLEICVARKRSLQIYNVTENKAIFVKDVSLPETPNAMAMEGRYVCVALATKYAMVDCETGSVQEILPYDILVTNPLIVRISKGEFLLNGPNALGVFVTTAMISERPPLQWSESLNSVAFAHPYVLALDTEFLTVYSVLDHKQKQKLPFQSGSTVDNYDGQIFATNSNCIYAVIPIHWEKQVQSLLLDKKVTEALELAEHCHWPGLSREQFKKVYRRIQQEAGFIEFSEFNFDRARDLFIRSQLDPRELIGLFPDLVTPSTNFVRSASPLHSIANVSQMCKGDEVNISKCREFLIHYLEDMRENKNNFKCRKVVDPVLMKLYAETNSSELITLIIASKCDDNSNITESVEILKKYERYHALALFYNHRCDREGALDIWMRLLNGDDDTKDDSFPGLSFVVEFLANLDDENLLWKYAAQVINKDPNLGVKIFTERSQDSINPDIVTNFLQEYPQALLKYLEHLVFVSNNKKEKFHTHLTILYLDNVKRLSNEQNVDESQVAISREKLQHMLRYSSEYRAHFVLAQLQNTGLHLETALLHGKLEEHDKALRLLVHRLNDQQAARDYCQHYATNRDVKYRQKLFHTLLGVYLDPSLSLDQQDQLFEPAISLLNSELAEFDATVVLRLLPDHWSASIVDLFLFRTMRRAMDTRRTKQIEKSLAKAENIKTQFAQSSIQSKAVLLTEEKVCAVCHESFSDSRFCWFSNGDLLVHPQCSLKIEGGEESTTEQHSELERRRR